MRGTRLRTRALGALLGVLWGCVSIACSAAGIGHGPSPSISPPSSGGESPTETVSPSSSASPGPESPLKVGGATLTISGVSGFPMNVSFSSIETPAVWAPPPAPMDITWTSGQSELHLSGTSFVSLVDTSADTVFSFTVPGAEGPVEFSSSAGECRITITPALPDQMGGVFTCTLLTDLQGAVTVDARGTFSASG